MPLRVLTCNTWVGRVDSRLTALIQREQPDVVTLHEWPGDRLPSEIFGEGWEIVHEGEFIIASRLPIVTIEKYFESYNRGKLLGIRCDLTTRGGVI